MNNKEFLEREANLLKYIPKSEVIEFIEKNWGKIRSLLEDNELMTNEEVMEALTEWFRWI
jgi:hypothetical protein